MAFIGIWIFLSLIVAAYAGSRSRDAVGYFILCFFLSPLVGFIVLLIVGEGSKKKCPRCAEFVKTEALICRFCQFEFPVESHEDPGWYNEEKNTGSMVIRREKILKEKGLR